MRLAEMVLPATKPSPLPPDYAGRQLRVLHRLVDWQQAADGARDVWLIGHRSVPPQITVPAETTFAELLAMLAATPDGYAAFNELALRQRPGMNPPLVVSLEQISNEGSNPELPDALQDLGDEISEDQHEACAAFDDPDCWYPGVDEGIPPMPDSHVALVIAAMQRELSRERRDASGRFAEPKLPPAPLDKLPWRIQRALAERRRLRFAQYGIGRTQWELGSWSLWAVQPDENWTPRRRNT